jgi:hypothetical protein
MHGSSINFGLAGCGPDLTEPDQNLNADGFCF